MNRELNLKHWNKNRRRKRDVGQQSRRRQSLLKRVELLERRDLLSAVDAEWSANSGALSVSIVDDPVSSGEQVSIYSSGEFFVVTWTGDATGRLEGTAQNNGLAANVARITVDCGNGPDVINLGTVLRARFSDPALDNDVFVTGGAAGDDITGSEWSDHIRGGTGRNVLDGGAGGNDYIWGGPDDDFIFGAGATATDPGGNDTIYGGGGEDEVKGFYGNDYINCGASADDQPCTIKAGQGDDTVVGGSGDDLIYGDDGDSANEQPNDPQNGGNDNLNGGLGSDTIYGEDGNDDIYLGSWGPGKQLEYANGGKGNDTLSAASDTGANYFGGDGDDSITCGDGETGTDPVTGDELPANAAYGNSGKDTIVGGSNFDQLYGQAGDDSIQGSPDGQSMNGDYIDGGSDCDNLVGSAGADTILGGQGDDAITTNGGDDPANISGGTGNNVIDGVNDNGMPEECHPAVNSVSASPNPVYKGELLTLTANVTPGDSPVVEVDFYLDSNADGSLDMGDEEIGTASGSTGPWLITLGVDGPTYYPGTYKAFAIALDQHGDYGNWKGGDFEVDQEEVTVQASASEISEQDGGSSTVTFTRTGPTDFDLTVYYSDGNGSAAEGQNFSITPPGSGSVVIPAGQSTATITVNTLDDFMGEEDDKIAQIDVTSFGDIGEYAAGAPSSAAITIDENTETFTLTAAQSDIQAGDSVDLTVTRSGDTTGTASIYFSVGGGAMEGTDYTITPSSNVTFASGQTTATITIDSIDHGWGGYGDVMVMLQYSDEGNFGSPSSADVMIEGPMFYLNAPAPAEAPPSDIAFHDADVAGTGASASNAGRPLQAAPMVQAIHDAIFSELGRDASAGLSTTPATESLPPASNWGRILRGVGPV